MVRISKQAERRARCPHRPRLPGIKTGPKKDNLPRGFKIHSNGIEGPELIYKMFIPKKIG